MYSIVDNDPFGRNIPVARDAILSSPLLQTKTMDEQVGSPLVNIGTHPLYFFHSYKHIVLFLHAVFD